MAKATRHGGVSFTEHELSDEKPPVTIRRAMLGGDSELAVDGNSSQESSARQPNDEGTQIPDPRKPAPTAENPSGAQDQDQGSSVSSTTGDGLKTDQELPDYSEWTYKDLQAECKVRDLNATGKAEELVARLEDDDAQRSTEDITDEDDDFA